MASSRLYNLENLISLRHDLHKHAELSFQEVRTQSKILEQLHQLGIKDTQIRKVVDTGLVVDIAGTAEPSGKPLCIALRADMDGLPIKEENPSIDYQSITNAAHMCGHDMHMTCLVGGTALILEKLEQIPSDKKIRLLLQPAEETEGGALPMIKEGAMEGVDEVYGFHNWPLDKPGKLFVKKGYMMACISDVHIIIHGKGGHSSLKDQLKDPLQPAVDIQVGLRSVIKKYKDNGEKFTVCLPYLKTGDAPNAIADTCEMRGLLRSFGDDFRANFSADVKKLVEDTCQQYGCTATVNLTDRYPPVFNTDAETDHVIRVAKKVYGEENVVLNDERLPVYGGEDFSYFSKEKPGTFFFLSSARTSEDVLHTNRFNPHDDMIPQACEMWLRLIEDRFGLNFNCEREEKGVYEREKKQC